MKKKELILPDSNYGMTVSSVKTPYPNKRPKRETCQFIYTDTMESGLEDNETEELMVLMKHFHDTLISVGYLTINANIDSDGYCNFMYDYVISDITDFILQINKAEYDLEDTDKWNRMIELLKKIDTFFYETGIMVIVPIKK